MAMKVWVVWLDDGREYASCKWHEANERYQMLVYGFGEDRVKMTLEIV